MAEKRNFSGISAAIQEAQQHPEPRGRAEAAEPTPGTPTNPKLGKRKSAKSRDKNWRQHTVLLERATHLDAVDLLKRKYEGQDMSDLLNRLLQEWVKNHSIKS